MTHNPQPMRARSQEFLLFCAIGAIFVLPILAFVLWRLLLR
jgi:hypothetical protein